MFGEKLRQLRLLLKVTQAEIASRLHITQDMVSKIENNRRIMSSLEILRLSKEYAIPVGFFYGEIDLEKFLNPQFRMVETLSDDDKAKIPYLKNLANKMYDIEEVLNPASKKIQRSYCSDALSEATIADIALEERKILGYDTREPIKNFEDILLSFNIKILKPIFDYNIHGAFLAIDENRHLMVVNSDNQPSVRNFTLGHEYGHYLFHRHRDFSAICRDLGNPFKQADKEKEADIFASEFLMPRQSFEDFRVTDESITVYLFNYRVSRTALVYRLHNLRLITQGQKEYYLNSGNYKPIESLEKLGLKSEEIKWHKNSIKHKKAPAKEKTERKTFKISNLITDDYRASVINAYERGLISLEKAADYLFENQEAVFKYLRKESVYDV